jgi:hypothetical protein
MHEWVETWWAGFRVLRNIIVKKSLTPLWPLDAPWMSLDWSWSGVWTVLEEKFLLERSLVRFHLLIRFARVRLGLSETRVVLSPGEGKEHLVSLWYKNAHHILSPSHVNLTQASARYSMRKESLKKVKASWVKTFHQLLALFFKVGMWKWFLHVFRANWMKLPLFLPSSLLIVLFFRATLNSNCE